MEYKRDFIEFMVRSGVLTFGEFVTKSGRNTPYFINTANYKTGMQAQKLGTFYADCIMSHKASGAISDQAMTLFGPAYKGIPLSVSTAISLASKYETDVNYCFNRKEKKDHGEGGILVGYQPQDGDRIIIVEDVITAGTAIRETLPILLAAAQVEVEALIVSVDRMERGKGEKTAIQEIFQEFGIPTFPLVTVREVIDALHNHPVDGTVVIDDETKERIESYMGQYCINDR